MTKFEQLDSLLEQGNGYITIRAVTAQGISKPYFAEYARSRELERVAHGVYQSRDAWPDDMYVLHLRNSNIIFSHQSALALHGMMERQPHHIYVTVKQGYNATHLRKQGVIVHSQNSSDRLPNVLDRTQPLHSILCHRNPPWKLSTENMF